jgi:hypothetical protein
MVSRAAGLLEAPQWNGKHGSIAAFDALSGRYEVRIERQPAVSIRVKLGLGDACAVQLKLKLENVLARVVVL